MSSRITLGMSGMDAMFAMSEGNPGAVSVICDLMESGEKIDPGAALGPFHHVMGLDSCGIYGSNIWVLYKDVCGMNLVKVIAVLRGWQLGFLSEAEIRRWIDENGTDQDLDALVDKVREELGQFGSQPAVPPTT